MNSLKLIIFFKKIFFFVLIYFLIYFFYNGYINIQKLDPYVFYKTEKKDNIKITKNEKNKVIKNLGDIKNPIKSETAEKYDLINEEKIYENIEEEIILITKKNDTFSKLINPYVKKNKIKQEIIDLINQEFNLKKINIGQKFYFYLNKENKNEILRIIIPLSFDKELVVKKIKNSNKYSINKIELPITTLKISKEYIISESIYKDGLKADVPSIILSDLVRLYSFDLDFQRDIKKGNKIELMYEVFHNENRRTMSYGNIEYCNIIFSKNNLEYFSFFTSDGYLDYFNKEGKNVKKALMKTPLDGAKLSSKYGMRKHPISGYNKMHKGVDFAAPKGTPIYAAGNGTIEFVGRNGGYGKYIRIRHNNSYKTAYAHLNSYNKLISKGSRVKQGEIIGYVGSTGKSTGPHLHYEVIYQGKQINPMNMKLPSGKILKGEELEKFIIESNSIYSDYLFNLFE